MEHVATATEIAAGVSPAKTPKRDTAVGLANDYLAQKMQDNDSWGSEGTTESDVRQALVNMFNAFVEKARREE